MSQTKAQLLNLTTLPQQLGSYSETYVASTISSGVLNLNLNAGSVFNVNLNANITSIIASNVTVSSATSFTVFFTADGTSRTVNWSINGSTVRWPSAVSPTLTSTNGKVDIVSFISNDGGSNWFGFIGGQNY